MSALKQTSFETVISMYAVSDNLGSFGKADSWTRANPAMLAAASGTNRKTSVPRNFRQCVRRPAQNRPNQLKIVRQCALVAPGNCSAFQMFCVLGCDSRQCPTLAMSNNINMLSKLFWRPVGNGNKCVNSMDYRLV